jgi:hypothetical protein
VTKLYLFLAIVQSFDDLNGGRGSRRRFRDRVPSPTLGSDRDNESMFRSITKLVHCPENVVPSSLWLERGEKRLDLGGRCSHAATVYSAFEISSGLAEGEMNGIQAGRTTQATNCNRSKVKTRSQILDCSDGALCQAEWERFGKSEFVQVADSIRPQRQYGVR